MSIMRQMKDKAISMAEAMAERARTPQDIEAARQRLVAEIQGGRVPAYVGVPLVQDLTQRLTQAKAQMAQQVAGMGVPQAPQGAPIAQQVMAQAQQPAGVEALPSNLPTAYAPGGLVAFEEGGSVERYAEKGYVYETPYDRMNRLNRERAAAEDAARLADLQERGMSTMPYGEQMRNVGSALLNLPVAGFKHLVSAPGYGFNQAAAPAGTQPPAGTTPGAPYDPATATRLTDFLGTSGANNAPPVAQPGAGAVPGVAMPKLNLPAAPALTDYSFLKQLPKESQEASEKAITAKKKELEDIDNPLFQAREERLSGREAAVDKDSAIGRALNLMSLGFGIAGSKERTLAGALGNEGRQGIADLIKGEAANRAAKERLEDLRDNLTQQRAAAKKGNAAAAEAAGQRVSDDLYKAANLNATAMHYGNTEALQRYQTNQQGVLGLAQIQQQNAATNASLQLGREKLGILKDQIAAGNTRAQAALAGAQQKAYAAFSNDPQTRMMIVDLQKKYGNLQHPEAQRALQQARQTYMMNALPALLGSEGGGSNIKDVAELLKD